MKAQRVGIVIQARMGSTRLPGKVLKFLDKDETVLDVLIRRIKLCKLVDEIIIATTPDEKNTQIIKKANYLNVKHSIGSEANVLERYYKASEEFNLDIILRITSDCPFIDPKVVDLMIKYYLNHDFDYISNRETNFPRGHEIEIFTFKGLQKVYSSAKNEPEKEHVTLFFYRHPELFKNDFYHLKSLKKIEGLRITVDEEDDLKFCKEIYKRLKENGKGIDFTIFDIIEIVEKYPKLININRHVQQKQV